MVRNTVMHSGQAQKEFFVNEALIRADLLLHCTIEGEAAAPPVAPQPGQVWLIGPSPTGPFAARTGSLAGWSGDGWRFVVPREGLRVFDRSRAAFRLYRAGWQVEVVPSAPAGGMLIDVEARQVLTLLLDRLVNAGIFATS